MLNPALQNTLNRQAEIGISLEKAGAELLNFCAFLTTYLEMLESKPTPTEPDPALLPAEPAQVLGSRADPMVLDSVKAARTVIGSANQPVTLEQLFQAVQAKGFVVSTSNPKTTYGARLRDHGKRFGLIALRGHGWWLRERAYAPANYSPATSTRHGNHVG